MNQEQNLPQWDNSDEYDSFNDARFTNDYLMVENATVKMNELQQKLNPLMNSSSSLISENDLELFNSYFHLETTTVTAFANMRTFTHCEQSLDAKNEAALKMDSKLSKLISDYGIAKTPIENFIKEGPESSFKKIINLINAKPYQFYFEEERKLNAFLLY